MLRRWFDDTIELVNTEVEFDEKSLTEFKRTNSKMAADIQANLKLFLNNRWQNAKKFTLPPILNFDERVEVKPLSSKDFLFLHVSLQNIFLVVLNQIQDKWNYWFDRNPILRSLYVNECMAMRG